MVFKLVVFSFFLASVFGSIIPVRAAVYGVPVAVSAKDCDPPSLYKFGYDVADSLTGDYKSQVEQRNGDVVQGQYSLVDSDGTLRVVQYTADAVNGFNAVVRNEPLFAEGSFVAEPAVVPARITAAPVVAQPAVSSETFFARYAAAAIAGPVVGPAAILPRYELAPAAARLMPAPVVSTQYGAPVTTTFNIAYGAPVGSQYFAEVAAPFAARIAAEYPAYSARYAAFSTPVAAAYREFLTAPVSTPPRAFYTGPAPVAVAPVAATPVAVAGASPVEVTPAKLVEATDTDTTDCA